MAFHLFYVVLKSAGYIWYGWWVYKNLSLRRTTDLHRRCRHVVFPGPWVRCGPIGDHPGVTEYTNEDLKSHFLALIDKTLLPTSACIYPVSRRQIAMRRREKCFKLFLLEGRGAVGRRRWGEGGGEKGVRRKRMVTRIGRVRERSAYVSNSTTANNEENVSVAVFAAFSSRVFSFSKVSAVDFFSAVARSSFSIAASAGAII